MGCPVDRKNKWLGMVVLLQMEQMHALLLLW